MYYLLLLLIIFALFLELETRKPHALTFYVIYFLMTCLCVFRYGQGTDYFNYEIMYLASAELNSWVFEKDYGFAYLCHILVNLGLPYQYFSALIAFISMVIAYPFFNKICNKSIFPIFIFYAYIYFIYPMSGIRQGLTIAILLGLMYPMLHQKKYIYYYLILAVGCTIHLSLLITALLPFIINLKVKKKNLYIIILVSSLILFLNLNFSVLLVSFSDRTSAYIEDTASSSMLPKILRFLIIIIILSIRDSTLGQENFKIRNILIFGYVVYSILSFSETLAGRFETYFRVFEMLFIFILIYKSISFKKRKLYNIAFFLLYFVLWFKNVQSQIDQGKYINTSILSYPYISIFHQNEISKYRSDYNYFENNN